MRIVSSKLLRLVGPFASLCVLGALGGWITWKMLAQYKSVDLIRWQGEFSAYRPLESILLSPQSVQAYAQAKGLTDNAILRLLRSQFVQGRRTPTLIERPAAISRADLRDLPDSMMQDAVKGSRLYSGISVTTFGGSPQEAAENNKITVDYVRDTVLRFSLYNFIYEQETQARVARDRTISEQLAILSRIDSIDHKIADMQQIAGRYSDLSNTQDIVTVPVPSLRDASEPSPRDAFAPSPRDVFEPLPRDAFETRSAPNMPYLSPGRQLVALESERVGANESLRQDRLLLARYTVNQEYGNKMLPLFSRPMTGEEILDAAEKMLSVYDSGSPTPDEAAAIKEARSRVVAELTLLRVQNVDIVSYFAMPSASLVMPSRTLFLAAGMLIGIALWFVGFRVTTYLAERQKNTIRPAIDPRGTSPRINVQEQIS